MSFIECDKLCDQCWYASTDSEVLEIIKGKINPNACLDLMRLLSDRKDAAKNNG